MARYAVQRIVGFVPSALLLIFVIVVLVRLMPGDIIDTLMEGQGVPPDQRAELERRLGIDVSIPEAYVRYLGELGSGSLGQSLLTGREVSDLLTTRLPVTMELTIFALIVGWVVGVTIGVISAARQDTVLDYVLRTVGLVGLTVPTFAIATGAVLIPAIYWNWTPPIIYIEFKDDPLGHLTQFIMPGLILGFYLAGSVMRITRTQMLEALRQDYTRTAYAKGLRERTVVVRHAVRNALIPVVSVFGVQLAALLSGAVIIESIFALPGVGRGLLDAVTRRDYPIIQGITVVIGLIVMLVNLAVDLSYGWLDPRIKA